MTQDSPKDLGAAQSGFNQLLGFVLVEWQPDHAVIEFTIAPHHLNRSGVLHGGVVATLIDATCGYAGCHCITPGNVRLAVTLSLTTSYMGSAKAGRMRCVARRRGGGRRIFMSTADVYDDQGRIIALGESTYQYRPGSEDPAGVAPSGDAPG